MIYLLDTDHVSLDQRGHPTVNVRILAAGPAQVAVSMITVEEQLRGWLAVLRAAKTAIHVVQPMRDYMRPLSISQATRY